MRILYLLHTSVLYQGSSKSIINSMLGLRRSGIEPFLLLPKGKDISLCKELDKFKISYRFIPLRRPIWPKKVTLKQKIFFIPNLLKLIAIKFISILYLFYWFKKSGSQLVHTNVGILSEAYWLSKLISLPHVWHLREFQDLDFNLDIIYSIDSFKKRIKKANTYPITISKQIATHFDLNNDTVIYNGIMSNKAIQFNSRKEKYLLFVGQISHHKGVESLLNAFNEIGTRYLDFKLKIVGDTKDQLYKEHIQSIAYEANLNERIEFLGNLEEATVYDLMSRAYFIVVPSLFEGFGRITVEAIFNGCFVLGRNSGGTKEILTTTPGGILFDDDEHLITIMEDLMANGMERFFEKMIYIQQEASELYSNEQNVSKILSLYHKILNR